MRMKVPRVVYTAIALSIALSIALTAVPPVWSLTCNDVLSGMKTDQGERLKTAISRYLKRIFGASGEQRNGPSAHIGDWSVYKFDASPDRGKAIANFLKTTISPNYRFLGEYYVVYYQGKVVSFLLSTDYKDWGLTNSLVNINVDSRVASFFKNNTDANNNYIVPGNEILNHALSQLKGAKENRITNVHTFKINEFPVPALGGAQRQFRNESYISFSNTYSGPNLKGNPYSAHLLAEVSQFLEQNPKVKKILVVGSGLGYETIHLLKRCPSCRVDASEIDPAALENTKLNIAAHQLQGRTSTYLSDLFENIRGQYDLIVFAPPRPVTSTFLNGKKPKNATDGEWNEHIEKIKNDFGSYDFEGKLLDRTLAQYSEHLNPGGSMMIMSDTLELPRRAAHLPFRLLFQGSFWGGGSNAAEGRYGIFQIHRAESSTRTNN